MLVSGGDQCINILVQKVSTHHIGSCIILDHTSIWSIHQIVLSAKQRSSHVILTKHQIGLSLLWGKHHFPTHQIQVAIFPIHQNGTTHFKSITWCWVPLSVILTQPDIYLFCSISVWQFSADVLMFWLRVHGLRRNVPQKHLPLNRIDITVLSWSDQAAAASSHISFKINSFTLEPY